MYTPLTDEQLSEFRQNGFLKLSGLVSQDQVDTLKGRVEQFLAGDVDSRIVCQVERDVEVAAGIKVEAPVEDATLRYPLRKFHRVAVFDEVFGAYMKSDAVNSALGSVLGDSYLVYSDVVFMKPARLGSRQKYHQDRVLGYDIDDEAAMAGLWLALDAATEENGCLRFIPGSHRLRRSMEETAVIEEKATSEGLEDEVLVQADPGDAILIDSLVLHSSEPNQSDDNRWAYSAFCVSCDALYIGDAESKPEFLVVQGSRQEGRI